MSGSLSISWLLPVWNLPIPPQSIEILHADVVGRMHAELFTGPQLENASLELSLLMHFAFVRGDANTDQ